MSVVESVHYLAEVEQIAKPAESMSIARLTDSGNAYSAAISPDGKYVLHILREGGKQSLWLRHIPTGSNTQVVLFVSDGTLSKSFSSVSAYQVCAL